MTPLPEPAEEEVERLRAFLSALSGHLSRRQGHSAGEGQ